MSPLSSFIFNSSSARPTRWRDMPLMGLWIVIALVMIDFLINFAFPYPSDPKNINPSRMQLYFDYGRSAESKLRRMTRTDPAHTAPITLAGWYSPANAKVTGPATGPVVTFYGMSHAVQLANALGRVTKDYIPRTVAAPGASGNWSYGAYLRDRGGGGTAVAVLALMGMNLPAITSVSPMNSNFDFAMPYTADRFYLDGDQIRAVHPPFDSFKGYVDAFSNASSWAHVRDFFSKTDSQYDPLLARESLLDYSSLVRLARRAYGQRHARGARSEVFDRNGAILDSEQVKLARSIVRDFAANVRADGMIPVIYIVNNLGYSDHLFRALEPILLANKIPYISSHDFASPNDPRKYLANSHFVDETDDEMARALVKLMDGLKVSPASSAE